jgi:phage shock protein A
MSESPDDVVDAEVVEHGTEIAPVAPVAPAVSATDYTEDGVPTFDFVRDRIEQRAGTAIGAAELAGETPQGKSADEQLAEREQAGRDRLEQIRRAMRGGE